MVHTEDIEGGVIGVPHGKKSSLPASFVWLVLAACAATFWGCGSKTLDNPRRGSIVVAADESFRPVVNALVFSYEGIYPDTHFDVQYKPEREAILALLKDEVRLVFVTRELTSKEKETIQSQQGTYKHQLIAYDGIALLTSEENTDSLLTTNELKQILAGKIKNWEELKGRKQKGPITLVIDNPNSSNLQFLMEQLGVEDVTKTRILTTDSSAAVIDYIRLNPTAIGLVGGNWLSDGDDEMAHRYSKGIRVMGISSNESPAGIADYHQPFQLGLGTRKYPLRRPLYIISREGFSGLGGGMMTYIARDVGGLVIQKTGLIPAIPFPRDIELKTKNF